MDMDVVLEPTTPFDSENDEGDSSEDEGGELDYEPSEPDVNDGTSMKGYLNSLDGIADGINVTQDAEDGEIDELEEGEVKDDDDNDQGQNQNIDQELLEHTSEQKTSIQSRSAGFAPDNLPPQRQIFGGPPTPLPTHAPRQTCHLSTSRIDESGICKFYLRSQCTWGSTCKFVHPPGQEGSHWRQGGEHRHQNPQHYVMPPLPPRDGQWSATGLRQQQQQQTPMIPMLPPMPPIMLGPMQSPFPINGPPIPLMPYGLPMPPRESDESAWERGLKQAKELMKRANEKREKAPTYEQRRRRTEEGDYRRETICTDSEGELERGRRSGGGYYEKSRRDRGHQSRRNRDDEYNTDRSGHGGNYDQSRPIGRPHRSNAYPSATTALNRGQYDDPNSRCQKERRPVSVGPQVLYPSRGRISGGRDSDRIRHRTNDYYRDSSSSSSRYRGATDKVADQRQQGQRRLPQRDISRPLPYDRPTYPHESRALYRDPWERGRKMSPSAVGKERTKGRNDKRRSSSSTSTFSSKGSRSSSRSKSRDTYSSSGSSDANIESKRRTRKPPERWVQQKEPTGRDTTPLPSVASPVHMDVENHSPSPVTPPAYGNVVVPSIVTTYNESEDVQPEEQEEGAARPLIKSELQPTTPDSSPSSNASIGVDVTSGSASLNVKKSRLVDKAAFVDDKDTRRVELLKQLQSVEDAIAKKRSKTIVS